MTATAKDVDAIIAGVAAETGISVEQIVGRSRKYPIARARALAMRRVAHAVKWDPRDRTQKVWTVAKIGAVFGGRSHPVMLHLLRTR